MTYRQCRGCDNQTLSQTGYCTKNKCHKIYQHIRYMQNKNGDFQLNEDLINQYTEKFNYTHECGYQMEGREACKALTKEGYCKTHIHRISQAKGSPCLNCKKLTHAKQSICTACKALGYRAIEVIPSEDKPAEQIN